jgi:hypothetical protein
MRDIQRFEEFDRTARAVRVFTRTERTGQHEHRWSGVCPGSYCIDCQAMKHPDRISQYDRHLMNRKPRPGG